MKIHLRHLICFTALICALGLNVLAQGKQTQTINGGVVNGRATVLPKPDYPPAAKAVRAEGAVNVEVLIDEAGKVSEARAVTGHILLRAAAVKAAYAAEFEPFKLSGQPVKVKGVIVYQFSADRNQAADIGVINGRAVSLVKPDYPAEARESGAEGTVSVRVVVDGEGNITSARAVSGNSLLHRVSEEAALKSKFKPAELSGKPTAVSGIIVYNFTAGRESKDAPASSDSADKKSNFSGVIIFGGILNEKAITLPAPVMSPAAMAVGASGEVKVEVTVGENGEIVRAEAVSGHQLLRKSAEKAALEARFSPTLVNGKLALVTGVIVYNFPPQPQSNK